MKKRLLLTMFALLAIATGAKAQEAYAALSTDAATLTFYYDTQRNSRSGMKFDLNTGVDEPGWYDLREAIKEVVFDDSFKDARPTTTHAWFYGFKVTEIPTIANLNTSEVTNMGYMFYDCHDLTSIDLSNFDTSKVTDMYCMFHGCNKLTSLDVSSFDTRQVTTMSCMFQDTRITSLDLSNFDTGKVVSMTSMFGYCYQLKSLDLSNFDTGNLKYMYKMFQYCQSLAYVDLSSFNTSKVVEMNEMFQCCGMLKSLDLSSFDTHEVKDMSYMFNNCSGLQTIYVGSEWNTDKVTKSDFMFNNCNMLTGQQGTVYDYNFKDKTYAHIDGGETNPGYLSEVVTYALRVKGKAVTSANRADILGDGTVSFDGDKTLTLNNASIYIDEYSGFGVYNQIPDLEVVVEGDNTIESKQWTAFCAIQSTHFKGTGTLRLKGYSWGLDCASGATKISVSGGLHLTCVGGERATAEGPGYGGGLSGGYSGRRPPYHYYTTVEVSGANTLLEVKGTGYASSLYDLKALVLNDGLEVAVPAGAAFDESENAVCDADGNVVKDEWVVIKGKAMNGDVNGDGSVDVADIATVIDVMAGKALEFKDAADVNGDTSIDVADVAAIIDTMAGKGGKAYTDCPDDRHPHLIDLGLPSGTKWACCNVGAIEPEEYGNYYAWGETKKKSEYTRETCIHYDGTNDTWDDLGDNIAGTGYDAATANWGAPWRMPTGEQYLELIDNCTSEWTTQNGVNGRIFVGPNGGTIFLPAAGIRLYSDLYDAGSCGIFWSSTPSVEGLAYGLYFDSGYAGWSYFSDRSVGRSVRPVR